MATRNITLTYPDGAAARIIAALKTHYGQINDNGTLRDRTNAEAFQAFEDSVKALLKQIVRTVESEAARQAAEAGISDADVT